MLEHAPEEIVITVEVCDVDVEIVAGVLDWRGPCGGRLGLQKRGVVLCFFNRKVIVDCSRGIFGIEQASLLGIDLYQHQGR